MSHLHTHLGELYFEQCYAECDQCLSEWIEVPFYSGFDPIIKHRHAAIKVQLESCPVRAKFPFGIIKPLANSPACQPPHFLSLSASLRADLISDPSFVLARHYVGQPPHVILSQPSTRGLCQKFACIAALSVSKGIHITGKQ